MQQAPTTRRNSALEIDAIVREITRGRRFLITSHSRPDGDSIGSQLALAFALKGLGKQVTVVNRDPAPAPLQSLPGVADIVIAERVDDPCDALFVMECGDLGRPGIDGLAKYRIVNIDHHPGNALYGAINWFDTEAAACGEMVMELLDAVGTPLTRDIATHIYVAILTDTGSFRYSSISPRTFEICRRAAEAGVDPAATARQVYETASLGKLRITGTLLQRMRIEAGGRLAVLALDESLLQETGASLDDTDGVINLPLSVKNIVAVAMFKDATNDGLRVSLRSKGPVDVRMVAQRYGGGGHTNAAGFTAPDRAPATLDRIVREVVDAIALAETSRESGGSGPPR
jgi:bifunctional oligoribonuclease and PAP phosphatase NrnA